MFSVPQTYIVCSGLSTNVKHLNPIGQGFFDSQRPKKRAHLLTLQCRGFAYCGTTTTFDNSSLIIVYDKAPRGVLPDISEMLTSVDSYGLPLNTVDDRFVFLKRINYNLSPSTKASQILDFELEIDLPFVAKRDSSNIDDVSIGAMYLVMVGNSPNSPSSTFARMAFRVTYVDV